MVNLSSASIKALIFGAKITIAKAAASWLRKIIAFNKGTN